MTRNVVDITISGSLKPAYRLPSGNIKYFLDKDGREYSVWSPSDICVFKLNAQRIELFQKQTYKIVEVVCRKKKISKLCELWWEGNDEKIYDVDIQVKGEKTVTMLKLSSGVTLYVDEDVSVFEAALNGNSPA